MDAIIVNRKTGETVGSFDLPGDMDRLKAWALDNHEIRDGHMLDVFWPSARDYSMVWALDISNFNLSSLASLAMASPRHLAMQQAKQSGFTIHSEIDEAMQEQLAGDYIWEYLDVLESLSRITFKN